MKYSIVLACLAATQAFAQDYFPLHIGNQWIYRTAITAKNSTVTVIDIPRTETINDKTYALVRGLPEGAALLRQSDDGTLYNYNTETKAEEVWAVFSTKEGDTYRTVINPCNQTARVESRAAKVSVPAGDFTNALAIQYPAANCADAGLERDYFAPYIGLVERTSQSIIGPRRMQLVYARVGGVTVLSGSELSFSVALDKTVYAAGEQTSVRLATRNTTPDPLTLQFTSGQRFDIAIRNAAGEDVYRWSATRTFPAVLGSETISGGERNWSDVITLANGSGQVLPAGHYTLAAWLTDTEPARFAATVGFDIR